MTQYAKTGGRLVYLRQDQVYSNEVYKCIACEHKLEVVYDHKTGRPSHFKHPAGSRTASLLKHGELCDQMSPITRRSSEYQIREYSAKTYAHIQRQIKMGEIRPEDLLKLLQEFNEHQGSLIVEYNLLQQKYDELAEAIVEANLAKDAAFEAEKEFNERALKKDYSVDPIVKKVLDRVLNNNRIPFFRKEEELEKLIIDYLYR